MWLTIFLFIELSVQQPLHKTKLFQVKLPTFNRLDSRKSNLYKCLDNIKMAKDEAAKRDVLIQALKQEATLLRHRREQDQDECPDSLASLLMLIS